MQDADDAPLLGGGSAGGSGGRAVGPRLAGGVAASDAEALYAVGLAFDELRLVAEPGGAVGLAALLYGQIEAAGRTIVVVLSGGNLADGVLTQAIETYRVT